MKSIKVIVTFILLLLCNSGFSFISTNSEAGQTALETELASEITEGYQVTLKGNRTSPIPFYKVQNYPAPYNTFLSTSFRGNNTGNENICYSKKVEINFSLRDIIFPFHSFL